jgi:hypothetical protein
MLAVSALAAVSFGAAQAGTLGTDGTWTSKCAMPEDPPVLSTKSPEAYNASAKGLPAWMEKAKAYQTCLQADSHADQEAVVTGANADIGALNTKIEGLKASQNEAIAKLKGGEKKKSMSAQ